MHTTNLRKVGGSVMLAVPPPLLDILRLRLEPKSAWQLRAVGSSCKRSNDLDIHWTNFSQNALPKLRSPKKTRVGSMASR